MDETWDGDDIIYSESCCEPQDIFYEGSEDEGYQFPSDRRLRYEEAGRRFLNGHIPSLMSASLEGPFDHSSGWINPWMSKRKKPVARKNNAKSRAQNHAAERSSTTSKRSQEAVLFPPANDCHLPSPESLKQAPQSQDHSFLGTEKLATVKKWQLKIDYPSSNHDRFWNDDKSDVSPPVKKRRANGSDWLKKASVKRRKSDVQKRRGKQSSQDDDVDELMTDVPSSSFDHVRSCSSPLRRKSPRNHAGRSFTADKSAQSDDELSPNKAAAATLSSPVSLQNAPRMQSCIDTKVHSDDILWSETAQSTPSHMRHVKRHLPLSDASDSHQDESVDNDAISHEARDMTSETSEMPVLDFSQDASASTEEDTDETAKTESVQQERCENVSEAFATDPETIVNGGTSMADLDGDVTAAPSTSPPGSTRKQTPNSSFRNILNLLVPSSPWKRLSQLTSGSLPSAVRSASQVSCSQQDNFISETTTFSRTEDAGNPPIEEMATFESASRGIRGEASISDRPRSPIQVTDCADSHDDQSALETAESRASVSLGGHLQDVESKFGISTSQQSPWAKSDEHIASGQHLSTMPRGLDQSGSASQDGHIGEAQSPWASHTESCVQPGNSFNERNIQHDAFAGSQATRTRSGTPEPQFCFIKPFASFMSPSPDRRQTRFSWRSSASKPAVRHAHGSLPSALKGNGNSARAKHRVSWAAPLTESDGSPPRSRDTAAMSPTHPPKRQRSPPPETPIRDVSNHCNDKFSKHFQAIAKRKDDGKTNLCPPGSPREATTSAGPPASAGAESPSAADAAIHDDDRPDVLQDKVASKDGTAAAERATCERGSEEPMDLMEDMVREMGDFWDPWNIDSELEQARKNGSRLLAGGT
ncbi:hypothetical protein E4U41_007200 [Claviceps citrina]|nr:hypothetical protein E4U41_007200 [Claviceps citrina]